MSYPKDDRGWLEEYVKARNSLHRDIVKARNILTNGDKVFLPVLQILEEEDLPVRSIIFGLYSSSVYLKDEVKLTAKAVERIKEKLGIKEELSKEVKDTFAQFYFKHPRMSFSIGNGKGTCKTIRREKYQPAIPNHGYFTKTFTRENGCSGMELT